MADTTDYFLNLSERVGTRVKNALAKVKTEKYGPEQWLSDAVGFWLDDVAGSMASQVGSAATVLIVVADSLNSGEISVPDPTKAVLSALVQVGGTSKIPTANITLATPTSTTGPTKAGTVEIRLVGTLPGTAGDQYVGWLHDGKKPLAQVVVLR